MRRILSLWLPQLPLDRRIRIGDERVFGIFAIVAEIRNAWRLTHLTDEARKAGLSPGLSLPDARAICPSLLSEPADPAREEALLRALWRWADQFSPVVSPDPPDGLVMDITGCAHLFGGEEDLAATIRQRAGDLRITACVGIADSKRAAAALARFSGRSIAISEPGRTAEALAHLPVAALGLEPAIVRDIGRAGIRTIDQLCTVRMAEIARRYGLSVTKALERSLGFVPDPVVPRSADPVYAARATLPEPLSRLEDVEHIILRLAGSVCGRLTGAGQGARRYRLTVWPVDGASQTMTIGFARPCAAADAVVRQFRMQINTLSLPFGADIFRLAAAGVEPAHPHQPGLDRRGGQEDDRADLISTLGNRLGFDRVRLFVPGDSHLPEREFAAVEAIDRPAAGSWVSSPRLRPVRMYQPFERMRIHMPGRPPLRFEWRHQIHESTRAEGPERLGGEWWREDGPGLRDYWRIETSAGRRLWLVNLPALKDAGWFVAGKFP